MLRCLRGKPAFKLVVITHNNVRLLYLLSKHKAIFESSVRKRIFHSSNFGTSATKQRSKYWLNQSLTLERLILGTLAVTMKPVKLLSFNLTSQIRLTTMKFPLTAFAALALSAILTPLHADPLPLVAHDPMIVPGPAERFDYMQVDDQSRRLFASHPGASNLVVLDLKTGAVQSIDTPGAVNGIAVDAQDGVIYAAGGGNHIIGLDRTTLAKVSDTTLDGPADDIALDTTNDTIYIDNDDGTLVWVYDAKSHKVIGSIAVGAAPEFEEYDQLSNQLYQNIKSTDQLTVIDAKTNTIVAKWPTAPATKPHGLALDRVTRRLFSVGANGKLDIFDMSTGKVIASIDVSPKIDQIAFDPKLKRVYGASGTGFVSVVQETATGGTLLGNVPVPQKAHTLAVDPTTDDVWISYADDTHSYLQRYAVK